MDTHPIPQNVTSFEFHLIGDMTLKQFGYLAAGLITAYITFLVIYPLSLALAIPIMTVSSLLGLAFAFLPLSDRPLDHWVAAYFKAIFRPTKRKWLNPNSKKELQNVKDPIFLNRLNLYLSPSTPVPTQSGQVRSGPTAPSVAAPTPVVSRLPTDDSLRKTVELARSSQVVQSQIVQAERRLRQLQSATTQPGVKADQHEPELRQVFDNLQSLIKQAQTLSTQISTVTGQVAFKPPLPTMTAPIPAVPVAAPKPPEPLPVPQAAQVKVVEPEKPKNTQLTLTSQPNVINGIVTDSPGNYLEGVVVVIHNKDGIPVRASKTNKLGQFAGATPLPDGTYTVTLEKDSLEFDTLEITLKGELLAPLAISAKKASPAGVLAETKKN